MSGYWAFVSYSQNDARQAAAIHRRLERYRVPSSLQGRSVGDRVVGSRMSPIFRDREDLSSAGSLTDSLELALQQSSALVVLCSPAAVRSRWVALEIERFIELNGHRRVFPLILSGEPNSGDENECFPAPLRSGTFEPVAGDLRASGDGPRDGLLKVVAGILDVPFNALKQRELRQQRRRLLGLASLATSVAVTTSLLAIFAFQQRDLAEQRRSQADGLITFMLGDLRERLQAVGRLDVLEAVGYEAEEYFESLPLSDLDDEALGNQATALRQIGEVRVQQGRYPDAQSAFRIALDQSQELQRRHPQSPDFLFDLSQAEYWVGYSHYLARQWSEAGSYFERYRQSAELLVAMAPENPKFLAELAYAHSNLGTAAFESHRFDTALEEFSECRRLFVSQLKDSPGDVDLAFEVAATDSWLGRVNEAQLKLDAALQFRQNSAAEHARIADSTNHAFHRQIAAESEANLARLLFARHELEAAIVHARSAELTYAQLVELDPSNVDWQVRRLNRQAHLAWMSYFIGGVGDAYDELSALVGRSGRLIATDPENADWRTKLDAMKLQLVELAILERDLSGASKLLDTVSSERLSFAARPELERVESYVGFQTAKSVLRWISGQHEQATRLAAELLQSAEGYPEITSEQRPRLALLRWIAGDHARSTAELELLEESGYRAPDQQAFLALIQSG